MSNKKPLGHKSYGHIPHLPLSRMGPSDHKCNEGQARIATEKKRDKHDVIICQEKLDGSNVGVAKLDREIIALTRAGYLASTSPYEQHHYFSKWVEKNKLRFNEILNEGERICGEWLLMAHGTRYNLPSEPFVAFDIFDNKNQRLIWDAFTERNKPDDLFFPAIVLSHNDPISIKDAIIKLNEYNFYGAIDEREGCVWRVERNKIINQQTGERKRVVDFLVKYVRPDKQDGIYMESISGKPPVWNCDLKNII